MRINIQINLNAELPHIKGSDVHLKKTVMNLISNAVEAMPEVEKISLFPPRINMWTGRLEGMTMLKKATTLS